MYDGWCALCNGAVRFILRYDRRRTLRFAPLQGTTARAFLLCHPHLSTVDSLIIIETDDSGSETIFLRSDGLLRIAAYLGGPWSFLRFTRIIPRVLRDAVYGLIAAARYRFFGRYDSCPLPPPEYRSRFLD